jgi:hypothetical protein
MLTVLLYYLKPKLMLVRSTHTIFTLFHAQLVLQWGNNIKTIQNIMLTTLFCAVDMPGKSCNENGYCSLQGTILRRESTTHA